MKLSQRNRNQTATKWAPSATDLYGNSTWTRTTIKVRWEEKQVNAVDFKGDQIVSKAVVYVGEDMAFGDYLILGNVAGATPPTGAYKVKNFSKIPNLAADDFIRKVIL